MELKRVFYASSHVAIVSGITYAVSSNFVDLSKYQVNPQHINIFFTALFGGNLALYYGVRSFGENQDMEAWKVRVLCGLTLFAYTSGLTAGAIALKILKPSIRGEPFPAGEIVLNLVVALFLAFKGIRQKFDSYCEDDIFKEALPKNFFDLPFLNNHNPVDWRSPPSLSNLSLRQDMMFRREFQNTLRANRPNFNNLLSRRIEQRTSRPPRFDNFSQDMGISQGPNLISFRNIGEIEPLRIQEIDSPASIEYPSGEDSDDIDDSDNSDDIDLQSYNRNRLFSSLNRIDQQMELVSRRMQNQALRNSREARTNLNISSVGTNSDQIDHRSVSSPHLNLNRNSQSSPLINFVLPSLRNLDLLPLPNLVLASIPRIVPIPRIDLQQFSEQINQLNQTLRNSRELLRNSGSFENRYLIITNIEFIVTNLFHNENVESIAAHLMQQTEIPTKSRSKEEKDFSKALFEEMKKARNYLLKQTPGFKTYSEDQLQEMVDSLYPMIGLGIYFLSDKWINFTYMQKDLKAINDDISLLSLKWKEILTLRLSGEDEKVWMEKAQALPNKNYKGDNYLDISQRLNNAITGFTTFVLRELFNQKNVIPEDCIPWHTAF